MNDFKFVMPADLEKGKDGEWRIRGLASTERADLQNEIIMQKGLDLTPIDKRKGIINFDHQKGPENTIGLLDGYTRTEKGLVIEGRLFKNHTKAKAVYEIMSSLADGDRGRIGLSVEGKILERDPNNPSIIKKCRINAVAITMNPVNTDTFADMVKSMNASEGLEIDAEEQISANKEEAVFTASQVMAIVQKALSIGSGGMAQPDGRSGGDALQPSNMASDDQDEKPKRFKKKMKKMDKSMYKSNLIGVLDKLQVLYPNCSRSEIWEAVKDRLETKFEKGGAGSGVRGHKTTPKYEHRDHPKNKYYTFEGDGVTSYEADEPSKDHIHPSFRTHAEALAYVDKYKKEFEKGIRIHNTSGKEREHKLYEEARQRDDYETNKDKSRAELNRLAQESGTDKHSKEKIRAQHDAAEQVGDRDHVRPNIKG